MFCLGLVSSYFYHGDLRRGRKGKKTCGLNGAWEQSAGSWGEALKPEAKGHLLSLVSVWWRRPRRFDYTRTLYNLQPISGKRSPLVCSSYLARVFDRNIWWYFSHTNFTENNWIHCLGWKYDLKGQGEGSLKQWITGEMKSVTSHLWTNANHLTYLPGWHVVQLKMCGRRAFYEY